MPKRVFQKAERTPGELAELRAERERFKDGGPGLEEMVAAGEITDVMTMGDYFALADLASKLREARESRGLSLTDLSERSGIDRVAIGKLETGKNDNPTLSTVRRVAEAMGLEVVVGLKERTGPEIGSDVGARSGADAGANAGANAGSGY
jgi:DNA-binding XRE family transcriptional regulator